MNKRRLLLHSGFGALLGLFVSLFAIGQEAEKPHANLILLAGIVGGGIAGVELEIFRSWKDLGEWWNAVRWMISFGASALIVYYVGSLFLYSWSWSEFAFAGVFGLVTGFGLCVWFGELL